MAKSITEGGSSASNVHKLTPKKPGAGKKTAQAAAAAAKADAMISGKPPAAPGPALGELPTEPKVTAPAFGANEPDAGVFLREVNKIRRQLDFVEEAKLKLKTEKGKLKDIRKLAGGVGLVMREVDEALDALNTEHVDLIAREARRRLYFEWLGMPIGTQGALPGIPEATDTEVEQAKWRKRGDIAGRLAEERKLPDGCPGHCVQAYLEGWDAGHLVFMQGSPLTAAAFAKDGSLKDSPAPSAPAGLVAFTEAHFQAGTELDEANLKSLLPGHHEAFHNAENVVAVFGTKKRILKEKDYVDTGEPDAEITEPEPAGAADLAAARAPVASEFA